MLKQIGKWFRTEVIVLRGNAHENRISMVMECDRTKRCLTMSPLKAPERLEDHHFLWGDAMFFSPRIYWWIAAPLKKKHVWNSKKLLVWRWFAHFPKEYLLVPWILFQCVDELSPPSTLKQPIVGGKGFCLWLRVRFDQNSAGIFLSKCIAPQMSLSFNQPLDSDRILTHSTIDKLSWKLHVQSGRIKFQLLISDPRWLSENLGDGLQTCWCFFFHLFCCYLFGTSWRKKTPSKNPTMSHWSKEWPLIHCDGT